jgi:hypothetical protein
VGPTEDLTKIANALAWYHKSLTTLITVKPGLALTQPVTISIGYFSPAGYGPGSPERLTQSYVASSGNRFLRLDPEGDGHLRRVHLDITLSEPKPGGGVYSYNVPVDMDLDPLYDVAISPLQFSLLDTCNIVGDTEIDFYWYSPDAQPHKNTFHTVGGRDVTIGPFAWTHAEVGASANLHPPTFLFRTVNTLDFNDPAFGNFAPGLYPSKSNLVPGKTQTNKGNLTAQNENGCRAYVQYPSTYTLRWYADLDSPMVRDHR